MHTQFNSMINSIYLLNKQILIQYVPNYWLERSYTLIFFLLRALIMFVSILSSSSSADFFFQFLFLCWYEFFVQIGFGKQIPINSKYFIQIVIDEHYWILYAWHICTIIFKIKFKIQTKIIGLWFDEQTTL